MFHVERRPRAVEDVSVEPRHSVSALGWNRAALIGAKRCLHDFVQHPCTRRSRRWSQAPKSWHDPDANLSLACQHRWVSGAESVSVRNSLHRRSGPDQRLLVSKLLAIPGQTAAVGARGRLERSDAPPPKRAPRVVVWEISLRPSAPLSAHGTRHVPRGTSAALHHRGLARSVRYSAVTMFHVEHRHHSGCLPGVPTPRGHRSSAATTRRMTATPTPWPRRTSAAAKPS
jgi:hypothetical protein